MLLYLLLADRAIEIVADRGLHEVVADSEWQSICAAVEAGIHDGDIEAAVIVAVDGKSVAILGLTDQLRPDAEAAVAGIADLTEQAKKLAALIQEMKQG